MMAPNAYLFLAAVLFFIGVLGVTLRRNVFFILLSIELMLNASNLTLVAFSRIWGDVHGQVLVFFIMALAAAEACVGLAIVVLFFNRRNTVQVDQAQEMWH